MTTTSRVAPFRWTRRRIAVDLTLFAWVVVLLLWARDVLRAEGSVVFMLAAAAAAIYLLFAIVDSASEAGAYLRGAGVAVVMVLLAAVPAAFDPTSFDVFNVTKYTLLVIGALILGGIWIVRAIAERRPPEWRNGLHFPVLALVGWTAVATVFSVNPRISLMGFYKSYDGLFAALAMTVVFFWAARAITGASILRALSVFYLGGAGLTIVYGFMQLRDRTFGGDPWDWLQWGEASFKGSSIWATFGNPNHLAGFLALAFPVGLVLFVVHRNRWLRALILILELGLLLELLQTTTRGAWLAAIAAMIVLGAGLFPDIRARPALATSILAAVVVGVVGSGIVLGRTNSLAQQFGSIFNFGGGSSAAQRVELWGTAVDMGLDRPITGYGPDTYRILFPTYQSERFVDTFGPDQIANGPHNTFLNYLSATGFPGLLAFLAVLAYAGLRGLGAWRRLRKAERRGNTHKADAAWHRRLLLVGILSALTAFVVQAAFNVQQIGLSFAFWTLLGLLCALALEAGVPDSLNPRAVLGRDSGDNRREAKNKRSADHPPPGRLLATALPVALVVAVLSWLASSPYRADHVFFAAQGDQARRANQEFSLGLRIQYLRLSREKLDDAIAINPWEAIYKESAAILTYETAKQRLEQGRDGRALELMQEAALMFERAIEVQPMNATMLDGYARTLLQLDQLDGESTAAVSGAIDALEKATRINPWHPEHASLLAAILADQGSIERAIEVVERGLAHVRNDGELLRVAAQIFQIAGDQTRATELWERVLEIDPADESANQALGRMPPTPSPSPS